MTLLVIRDFDICGNVPQRQTIKFETVEQAKAAAEKAAGESLKWKEISGEEAEKATTLNWSREFTVCKNTNLFHLS